MEQELPIKTIVAGVISVIIIILFLIFNPFVQIDAGERGVVMTWGQVSDEVLGEGIHWKTPIAQKVKKIDVKTQKVEKEAVAYSKDLQTATALIALNFHVQPDKANKLWQEVGEDYEGRVISPAIQEVVKQVSSKYDAQNLISQRTEVKTELKESITNRLADYNIAVDDISVVNFDFSDAYEKAIEEKQVAEQNAAKAENDLKRIEVEARQKIETAKADAESIRIQGEALEKNPKLVDLKAVEKWNGVLPQYNLGGATPFIQIPGQK